MNDVLAKKMYTKYCEAVGGKAYNGDLLPTAEDFFNDPSKKLQADAWRETAKEPEKLLKECALNLAHPAYEHSMSVKEHIDELKERALDYLEFPKS